MRVIRGPSWEVAGLLSTAGADPRPRGKRTTRGLLPPATHYHSLSFQSFMIPLHTHPTPSRDPDTRSDMDESVTSTTAVLAAGRKAPSIHSAARARVYKWSRRIMITTESLWLKKIRRNKFKTFLFIFLPSALIFLLAFTLAPPQKCSDSNNLMYYMGGLMEPQIMFTAGVTPKRIHSRRDCKVPFFSPSVNLVGLS